MSSTGASPKQGRKFVWLGIGLVVILLASMYFWHAGYFHWPHPVKHAEARMDARAMNEFNTAAREAEKSADFEQAARGYHEAKNELAHNRELIEKGPKNCAGNFNPVSSDPAGNWTEVNMELSQCEEGAEIPLHFGNTHLPAAWRVEITRDGKKVPGRPDVRIMRKDGFSVVNPIDDPETGAENVVVKKGDTMYVFHQEGDAARFTLLRQLQ